MSEFKIYEPGTDKTKITIMEERQGGESGDVYKRYYLEDGTELEEYFSCPGYMDFTQFVKLGDRDKIARSRVKDLLDIKHQFHEWRKLSHKFNTIMWNLPEMTDEERKELHHEYCPECKGKWFDNLED